MQDPSKQDFTCFVHFPIFKRMQIYVLCSIAQSDSLRPYGLKPAGLSCHGIFLASLLKWVAISFSRGSPDPGIEPVSLMSPALQTDSLPLSHWGSHAKICAPTNLNKCEVI